MWTVLETREASRALDRAPAEIRTRYAYWVAVVEQGGPRMLRPLRGMHDEALQGEWDGFRSSRLNLQWGVIYYYRQTELTVTVARITPHDYRR